MGACDAGAVISARSRRARARLGVAVSVAACALACDPHRSGPRLEKADEDEGAVPDVPTPPEDGPRLGALSNLTPILDRPSRRGAQLGTLHAGETIARSEQPISIRECGSGWFAVRPRGFVCAEGSATTNLRHPTLIAMAMTAHADAVLPYAYARTTRDTVLLEPDPSRGDTVREVGTVRAKSGLAIVGSWTSAGSDGKPLRLAMTTDGRFVPSGDLEAASPSDFRGVTLGREISLPVAFVVKRNVHAFRLRDDEVETKEPLEYHTRLDLTGKPRKLHGAELWTTADGRTVRASDVTVVRARAELPAFASGKRRWVDVSVANQALVAYEGESPVFATLVSARREHLDADDGARATERGEHAVVAKHLSTVGRDPLAFVEGFSIYDVPWALELSSAQLVVGAYWHDRFGIEHGTGNIELSPADAAWLFRWATPELPSGWHGVTAAAPGVDPTIVLIH